MPLLFLVPAILAGLAAIGVPVLLHLRRREREKPMRFPSLMFLSRVTITTARRRRITDLPLLLLRALVIILAVLAFARPVVRPKADAKTPSGSRRVILLIDRSMSMSHLAVWPAAIDSAKGVISGLSAGDRIAVVSFDEEATVEQPLTADHAAALAAIARIQPGSRGTRYGAGIRAAREMLTKEADVTGGEVLVVTDLQRAGAVGMAGLALPPAVKLRAIPASLKPHGNTSVTGLTIQRLGAIDSSRNRLALSAQVASHGLAAVRHARVTMTINGRAIGAREVQLPVDGAATVAFDAVSLPVGTVRVVASVDHDSLVADDSFNAIIPAQITKRVVLAAAPDIDPDELLYFERALETGEDPAFKLERRNIGALDATTLRDAVAVVLYDVAPPGGSAGTALAAWTHDGGGVIVVSGTRMAARPGTSLLLPGVAKGTVDRTSDRGGILGATALEHPVFAAFRASAGAPLGASRFYRYSRLVPSADAQVIARFDDGNPALLERQEGTGRVLLDAVPIDAGSGDFPIQPTYLPYIRSLALHAAGNAAVPLARATGDGWLVPATTRNPVVKAPSGKLLRNEDGISNSAVTLDESGFYTVYEGRASGDPVMTVAVNPVSRESNLAQMPATEMLVGVGQDTVRASVMTAATLAEAEGRQRIWRVLLIAAALLLVLEMIVASAGWRGAAATVVGTASEGGAT